MIRKLEKSNAVYVIGESAGVVFAVVIDPNLYRAIFGGSARKSEVLAKTHNQVEELLGSSTLTRAVDGDKVTAVVITMAGGQKVELHPNCLSAADAYEANVGKKAAEVGAAQQSA